MMNDQEFWGWADGLAALERVKKFNSVLQSARVGNFDSLLETLYPYDGSISSWGSETPDRRNLLHSIRWFSSLSSDERAKHERFVVEMGKMVDLLADVLKTDIGDEEVPRPISHRFRRMADRIIGWIIGEEGIPIELANLIKVFEAFKVASVQILGDRDWTNEVRLASGESIKGLVERSLQWSKRGGQDLTYEVSDVLDLIARRLGWLGRYHGKEVIALALEKDNILAHTDIRFRMQDVIDVIREAVESCFGRPAEQSRFNNEWGDAGHVEVEFGPNPEGPSSLALENLPFRVGVDGVSVIEALIDTVLLQTGQKGKLEAHPGNSWIDENEIGFVFTPVKEAENKGLGDGGV